MTEICALVAAAGRGSRANLPYPKTLFSIQGKPILVRLLETLAIHDKQPTVIVSPDGEAPVRHCLAAAHCAAHIVVQAIAGGMGDAVLQFEHSPAFTSAKHILLVWGDIPFIQPETVAALIAGHLAHDNDFTFATGHVESAYTIVSRDAAGRVTGVSESRELGNVEPQAGERDIGLFVFRKSVMHMLNEDLPGKWGSVTGEHGFLYIIGHLAARGFRVEALQVATELDLVSLNCMTDVASYL